MPTFDQAMKLICLKQAIYMLPSAIPIRKSRFSDGGGESIIAMSRAIDPETSISVIFILCKKHLMSSQSPICANTSLPGN
jgi:hypothetical protein